VETTVLFISQREADEPRYIEEPDEDEPPPPAAKKAAAKKASGEFFARMAEVKEKPKKKGSK
jgi:hypothetical protein